jgi:tripartite-type tricarboxylate transporter receptor subunit TctC
VNGAIGDKKNLDPAVPNATTDLPDVPTLREPGFPEFEAVGWYGIFTPRGAPEPVAAKINAAINAWLPTPRATKALRDLGMQPAGGSTRDLADWITLEDKRWGSMLKTLVVPQ